MNKTQGIVLRSVKYGDTSLIVTIFTSLYGIQAYMVQGVRSSGAARNRAGLLQPAMLQEMVVYHSPQKKLQRIREFQSAYLYTSILSDILKNSVALFSVELLLRLLPEEAPLPDLFDFAFGFFVTLDKAPRQEVGNFPLYFIIHCSRQMGYEIKGSYSAETPHLDLQEGGFTANPPAMPPYMPDSDGGALSKLLAVAGYPELQAVELNAATRMRLTEWYVAFLQQHTQHMGAMRSLPVLQAILH